MRSGPRLRTSVRTPLFARLRLLFSDEIPLQSTTLRGP